MKWSLYIGKVSGIKIFIHWTFLILITWIIFSGFSEGNTVKQIALTLAFVAVIFTCIVLHELGHAITAKQFSYKTRDIILLPIGGLARMEGLPEKPSHEFLVAIMGPAVNVLIGLILFFWMKITDTFPAKLNQNDWQITGANFIFRVYVVNIFLAVFNLIPAFPMDGGRVLRALLAIKLPRVKATRAAAYVGQFIAVVFIFVGFFYNPFLIFIGLFVFISAKGEANIEVTRDLLKDITVGDVLMHRYSELKRDEPLSKAVSLLLDGQEQSFLVKDDGEVKGIISKNEILDGLAMYGSDAPVEKVMQKHFVILHPEDSMKDALTKFADGQYSLVPVLEDNKIVGVINLENIDEYLQVKVAVKTADEKII